MSLSLNSHSFAHEDSFMPVSQPIPITDANIELRTQRRNNKEFSQDVFQDVYDVTSNATDSASNSATSSSTAKSYSSNVSFDIDKIETKLNGMQIEEQPTGLKHLDVGASPSQSSSKTHMKKVSVEIDRFASKTLQDVLAELDDASSNHHDLGTSIDSLQESTTHFTEWGLEGFEPKVTHEATNDSPASDAFSQVSSEDSFYDSDVDDVSSSASSHDSLQDLISTDPAYLKLVRPQPRIIIGVEETLRSILLIERPTETTISKIFTKYSNTPVMKQFAKRFKQINSMPHNWTKLSFNEIVQLSQYIEMNLSHKTGLARKSTELPRTCYFDTTRNEIALITANKIKIICASGSFKKARTYVAIDMNRKKKPKLEVQTVNQDDKNKYQDAFNETRKDFFYYDKLKNIRGIWKCYSGYQYQKTSKDGATINKISLLLKKADCDITQIHSNIAPLTFLEEILLTRELAIGLANMHRLDIIHGDLKGNNALMKRIPNGGIQAGLIDFGTTFKIGYPFQSNTILEGFYGSIDQTPPELYRKPTENPIKTPFKGDLKAMEVFAFGTICWGILTQQRAFPWARYLREAFKTGREILELTYSTDHLTNSLNGKERKRLASSIEHYTPDFIERQIVEYIDSSKQFLQSNVNTLNPFHYEVMNLLIALIDPKPENRPTMAQVVASFNGLISRMTEKS